MAAAVTVIIVVVVHYTRTDPIPHKRGNGIRVERRVAGIDSVRSLPKQSGGDHGGTVGDCKRVVDAVAIVTAAINGGVIRFITITAGK